MNQDIKVFIIFFYSLKVKYIKITKGFKKRY